ncbi:MAG: immune inhibitor A [bacterium]|nr:immune inhibitor A [bacterium]
MRKIRLQHPVFPVLCLIILLSLSPQFPAHADEANAYPTLTTLNEAVLPPLDRIELARQLLDVTQIDTPPATPVLLQEGDRSNFWAVDLDEEQTFEVTATLRVVGEHLYAWVEDGVSLNEEALRGLVAAFDTNIYQQTRALWGSEASPGIDADPRVHALFARNLGGSIAAYYAGRHSFPAEVVGYSNEMEMFFFNLDTLGTSLDDPSVESTLAHEFQHMIRANVDANEWSWLDEGFSVFTEYLLGYDDVYWAVESFLAVPATQLNTWAYLGSNAPHYGASMLFVLYFYERYGLEALQAVSSEPIDGLAAFDTVLQRLGEPGVNDLFADWVLANALQDWTLKDGRYGYQALTTRPAFVTEAVGAYPFTHSETANQYSTHYYTLVIPGEATALEISLSVPTTVPLVPAEAYSGQSMWYSNRGDSSASTLTRAFDLSTVSTATLTYQVWYEIEAGWDYGYVLVSVDEGATWDVLTTPDMMTANPHGNAYGPGYSGESAGWLLQEISLNAYAGQPNVLVRFAMMTDEATNLPGMLIDDVAVPEVGYFSDFEADGGDWQPEGWLWMDNMLPQQVWVQAVQHFENDVEITRWLANGDSTWSLELGDDVRRVTLAVSPFAPVTTEPTLYEVQVEAR